MENIIVTGASAGVGYETARKLANKGFRVFVVGRREQALKQLASGCPDGSIIQVPMDLSFCDNSDLIAALNRFGVKHVQTVIHCAGHLVNKPFGQTTLSDWMDTFKVNVFGVACLTRDLLSFLGGDVPSHIVTLGSIGGIGGSVKFAGLSAYSSSKGALHILTEMLAEEFKEKNVFVNCLALGAVRTEMLAQAFPGYEPAMTAVEMGDFVAEFGNTGWRFFNGKVIPVATTTP